MVMPIKFKPFLLSELFEISYGNKMDLCNMEELQVDSDDAIAFVTRSGSNNGIGAYVKLCEEKPFPKGAITVALGGSLGSAFLQVRPFYTAQNVAVLLEKSGKHLTDSQKLFIATIIRKETSLRFTAFGRELNKHIKQDFTIELPVNNKGELDLGFMENFIKSLKVVKPITHNSCRNIKRTKWIDFHIKDIFTIKNGVGVTNEEISEHEGDFPAVQSGAENNGIIGYIDLNYCRKRNYCYVLDPCLAVARTGSSGYVSFHPKGCVVGDSAKILELKDREHNSIYTLIFLRTILLKLMYKYAYGRKVTEDKYYDEIISLPVTPDNRPDWLFIENYIKSLPYGDCI